MSLTLDVTILDVGPALAIELGEDAAATLGGKRVPVKVTLNGTTFRTTTAVMGGRLLIGINRANRTATGVSAGETVTAVIERDTEPRVVEVPPELAEAFALDADAAATWRSLSCTHQREYAEWITGAKRADTRRRRATAAVERLAGGRTTPR